MTDLLKIAVWNANGLRQHAQELKLFIQTFHIDILLVAETHFTARSYIKTPNYTIYHNSHPDESAHGGTAVITLDNKFQKMFCICDEYVINLFVCIYEVRKGT